MFVSYFSWPMGSSRICWDTEKEAPGNLRDGVLSAVRVVGHRHQRLVSWAQGFARQLAAFGVTRGKTAGDASSQLSPRQMGSDMGADELDLTSTTSSSSIPALESLDQK